MNWFFRCFSLLRAVQHPREALHRAKGALGTVKTSVQTVQTMIFRETLNKARQGDAKAQLHLGERYYDGQGVAQDFTEASKWFRRAAEQGVPRAQVNLGTMCFLGRGVPRDPVEAYQWIYLAAMSKHPSALKAKESIARKMKPEDLEEGRRRAQALSSGGRAKRVGERPASRSQG